MEKKTIKTIPVYLATFVIHKQVEQTKFFKNSINDFRTLDSNNLTHSPHGNILIELYSTQLKLNLITTVPSGPQTSAFHCYNPIS